MVYVKIYFLSKYLNNNNKNKCYEKKPNNSIYLNEKLKIFKCNEGNNFEKGECRKNIKCFKNCELCSEESSDEKDQKMSCENGFLFQEDKGNCLNECLKEAITETTINAKPVMKIV